MPKKILVIDDDDDVRNLIYTALSSEGYDVITMHSGKEALQLLMDINVDCVLLDVMMPEMDGWETLRMIRAGESTKDLPVIMVTVKDSRVDKLTAIKEKATDYITKPFDPEELVTKVREVLHE